SMRPSIMGCARPILLAVLKVMTTITRSAHMEVRTKGDFMEDYVEVVATKE
ncbi:hypothetical protein KI387_031203, partial [Taxus chinensis]